MACISIDGFPVLVDEEDIPYIQAIKWWIDGYALLYKGNHYFKSNERIDTVKHTRLLHRFIMKCKYGDGKVVDHIDGNTLDCRKQNLRITDRKGNQRNCKTPKNNTSGYKGVGWHKVRGMWRAYIRDGDHEKHIGHFLDKKDAAIAYNNEAIRLYGQFARLNIVEEVS